MVLWASAFIAIRAVGEHYTAGAMALGRLVIGAIALGVVGALRSGLPRRRPPRPGRPPHEPAPPHESAPPHEPAPPHELTQPHEPAPAREPAPPQESAPPHEPAPAREPAQPHEPAPRLGPPPRLGRALRPGLLPRGRGLVPAVATGVLWFGVYTILVNSAERHLDAGTTAMLINIAPILVVAIAGIVLREGFPRPLLAGLSIAFTGVTVIAVATSTGRHDPAGALLAICAAGLYASGVLLQKQALRHLDPFAVTRIGCLAGALTCLPFAGDLLDELGRAPAAATAGIVYLGLFPTAIAFATWSYALAHTSAGKLSSSSYLVPGLAVLMSWLLLAESPQPLALAGGALCLLGVAVARLPARRGADR